MNARPVIFSLNMLFCAYDGNTLTPLANYLTVQSPFPRSAFALSRYVICRRRTSGGSLIAEKVSYDDKQESRTSEGKLTLVAIQKENRK